MKFYEVLKSVMEGNKAYRKGWNGKNMFIYLERGSVIPKSKVNNDTLRFSLTDKEVTINPHIDLKNSKGELQVGWSPSQEDLLADDWQDFYFQDKNKPIDTIHGGFIYPDNIEEMSNKIKETLQDLFEESDYINLSKEVSGIPTGVSFSIHLVSRDKGLMRYNISRPVDSLNLRKESGSMSVDDIIDYIYNGISYTETPYRFREFIKLPGKVIYETCLDILKYFE